MPKARILLKNYFGFLSKNLLTVQIFVGVTNIVGTKGDITKKVWLISALICIHTFCGFINTLLIEPKVLVDTNTFDKKGISALTD